MLNLQPIPVHSPSIEKMVAVMEAELAKSPGLFGNTHVPHDPNYGLDTTFGLDTGFIPAIPNVGQDSNATQYSDPSIPDFGCSLPYPAQDPNIRDPDLPHSSLYQDPSFIPGLDIAQDPSFNFPLDPSFDLADEKRDCPPFAASTQLPDASANQYSDPNVQDNTPYLYVHCDKRGKRGKHMT